MFWKKRDPQWAHGVRRLQGYKRLYGDGNVPLTYVCKDGFRLGRWLHAQKRLGKRLPVER